MPLDDFWWPSRTGFWFHGICSYDSDSGVCHRFGPGLLAYRCCYSTWQCWSTLGSCWQRERRYPADSSRSPRVDINYIPSPHDAESFLLNILNQCAGVMLTLVSRIEYFCNRGSRWRVISWSASKMGIENKRMHLKTPWFWVSIIIIVPDVFVTN